MNKSDLYGNMTQEEISLVFHGMGDYKGWRCPEIGSGKIIMKKGSKELSASRGLQFPNWVVECWTELKTKIDDIEDAS